MKALFVSLRALFVTRIGAELTAKSLISCTPTTTVVGGGGLLTHPLPLNKVLQRLQGH